MRLWQLFWKVAATVAALENSRIFCSPLWVEGFLNNSSSQLGCELLKAAPHLLLLPDLLSHFCATGFQPSVTKPSWEKVGAWWRRLRMTHFPPEIPNYKILRATDCSYSREGMGESPSKSPLIHPPCSTLCAVGYGLLSVVTLVVTSLSDSALW